MACLFISLAPAANKDAHTLRQEIVRYLGNNPIILDDLCVEQIVKLTDNITLHEYLHKMSNSNTWGGALEIRAFAELYQCAVTVHVLYTSKKFTITPSVNTDKIMHISYTGSHFEPLVFIERAVVRWARSRHYSR